MKGFGEKQWDSEYPMHVEVEPNRLYTHQRTKSFVLYLRDTKKSFDKRGMYIQKQHWKTEYNVYLY